MADVAHRVLGLRHGSEGGSSDNLFFRLALYLVDEGAEVVVGDHGTEELKDYLRDEGAREKIVDDLERAYRNDTLQIWALSENARGDIHDKIYIIDEKKDRIRRIIENAPEVTEKENNFLTKDKVRN